MEITVGTNDMLDMFVGTINKSYTDLSVTKEQIENYSKMPVFCSDLQVLLEDKSSNYVGCGIDDCDKEASEMIQGWIQVIPSCRGRGYGQYIVNELLSRAQGQAKFSTVSGKINSATHPEKLYRRCGFIGNGIWHILFRND